MREHVVDLISRSGPMTGAELAHNLGCDRLELWRACRLSEDLVVHRVGRRYLRLDRRIDGYARLSPSILREFLTYSVVGMASDQDRLRARVQALQTHVQEVSSAKLDLARRLIADVVAPLAADAGIEQRFCVGLAGDIVFEMAHDVPRPERSTGTLVRGSDLDIVVIMRDDVPSEFVRELDETIYRKKYQYLKQPAFREEIDYIVKRFGKLREQADFDTFQHMLACKVFDECRLLHGDPELFAAGKELLASRGLVERLAQMRERADRDRGRQEQRLLTVDPQELRGEDLFLFHTADESEEFQ
ncbi:MAG: hypothetical protein QG608_351 [Actinomycetota bacterium]|nr:hypothetical protein [Actinomycetota bacterium]